MGFGPGEFSDRIELGILPAQAVDQRAMVGPGAGDALDQVGGPIALALAMDLLAEPAEQAAEVAAREGLVEAAQVGAGRRRRAGPRRRCPAYTSGNSRSARRSSGCPGGSPRRRWPA